MGEADFVICGGRIIDPSTGLDGTGSIGVRNGKIAFVDMDSSATFDPERVVQAEGCIVIPGMIDCHVHAYEYVTPLGVNIDGHCLARGVTTVVDAGSSAKGGECDHLNQVDVDKCVQCVKENPDMIVGVKVRASTSCTDDGRLEEEVYRRAMDAARESGVPLMAHHTVSSIPTYRQEGKMCCPLDMRSGDIYTHTFHPHPSHIVDEGTRVILPDVWRAKEKGIIFDIGHGQGSFSWTVAEIATKEGFWPDIISTDLHTECVDGPAYDLVTVMTKMHALGMPLNDVIASVTSRPAAAINRSESLGSLQVGREADISMLKIDDWGKDTEDCYGQVRRVKTRFVPVGVWRGGKRFDVTPHRQCPNIESLKMGMTAWHSAVIKDSDKPTLPSTI